MTKGEKSEIIKKRVMNARKKQDDRQQKTNDQLSTQEIKEHCNLSDNDKRFLYHAIDKLGLSGRAYDRILKTARTIADIAGKKNIEKKHLSEAINFRSFDR